ncbi:hypothetical protein RFI_00133, partial [Reticulomyxa filosa]
TPIKLSRDLRKNIVKPYEQLLKITYTSTITKANKLVFRLNRNSNEDNIQDIVNDINAAVSGKYIICHVPDSEFKTKGVVVKGIYPEEDIADIQSELENEGHAIRTVYRSKKSQTVIHIHYKSINQAKQEQQQEITYKNEILDPNTAIKLDRLTF